MPRRGKRRRLAEGIYADRGGIAAVVKVGDQREEKRFPAGTDLQKIRDWRATRKYVLSKRARRGAKGTLQGDSTAYLKQIGYLASLRARRAELDAWIAFLGEDRPRDRITREDVLKARTAWLAAGKAPKTVNNRVQTLKHLYRTLDGPDAETPADHLPDLHVGKTPPVYITPELVQRVDAELQRREHRKRYLDQKTRARFRVLATTGKRPSEVMRAQPADVDLDRRIWIVRDGKGGFSPGLYLNDDMLSAWDLFIKADAWGTFSTDSMARRLRNAGWPTKVRVYNLRHTTWITASERGADLSDVQAGAGHKSAATTRRHYVPVLESRMQRLSELIDHRYVFEAVPPVPPDVPPTPRATRQKPEQMGVARVARQQHPRTPQPRKSRGKSR